MQYLLPLLCVTAFLIINTAEKIKIIVNKLLLKHRIGLMGLSKEIKKETIGNASLKDFVSIIAADTDRYKRKDTITNVNTNRDIQDVRLKEEQYL